MPDNFEMGPQDNSNNSAKEETRDENNLSEPRPVEEIIPGIQEVAHAEENIQQRIEKGDRGLDNDFWRHLVKNKINRESYKQYVKESRADGSIVFQEGTPDVFELPDFIQYSSEDEQRAMKLFEGQIVIDLGAGTNENGILLSQELRAKAYVGVEPFSHRVLEYFVKNLDETREKKQKNVTSVPKKEFDAKRFLTSLPGFYKHRIPYSIVENDMLTFLKRLPDNSVSITMGGIDLTIIRDPEYKKQVMQEIERVLSPQGAFLSYCSRIEPSKKLETIFGRTTGAKKDQYDYGWGEFVLKKRSQENLGGE
jgi:hypothetical protein